ncbi:M23 family metallopeptidase [Candidatus Electronema sp. PJ]|uniref:M23 family metallopeptidase n=1 Tax=Candidatus Electronema sp. PJ TaxID=3401572 RepID=UPI003AA7E376
MFDKYSSIPEQLHLVITGETGNALSFVVERDWLALCMSGLLLLLLLLPVGTWFALYCLQEKNELAIKTVNQARELESVHADYTEQLDTELAQREKQWQEQAAAAQARINSLEEEQEVTEQQFNAEKERLICRYEEELAAATQAGSIRISSLVAELEQMRQGKQKLLEKTAGKLDERSRMIETVMSRIGIEIKVGRKQPVSGSGGPFLAGPAINGKYSEQLLERSDRYLKAIQQMPLGLPMRGRMTSSFGSRLDPFNNQLAFHAGIDFKGSIGDNVTTTADGVVKESGWDSGGYGNYVIVRHGGGYATLFGHLSKVLVKKGDTLNRGDVVGLMGNSGRSTGPHLHYEVHYQGKAVDPEKYLSVADLSFTVPSDK